MQEDSLIKNILLVIFLLAITASIVFLFVRPIPIFTNKVQAQGLLKISKQEALTFLNALQLNNKNFFEINSLKITKELEKRPLIQSVIIRPIIKNSGINYQLLITEERPWAMYNNQVLNNAGKVIIKSPEEAQQYKSPAAEKLYQDYLAGTSHLVTLSSQQTINEKLMSRIINCYQVINEDLNFLKDWVMEINLEQDGRLNFRSKNYQIILGNIDQNIEEKAKRFDMILAKVYSFSPELDYIDLSLNSQEVILGKKL